MAHFRAVILGSPGSGKGTIAARAIKSFSLAYLSCGDMIRNFIKTSDTELARNARKRIEQGLLLENQLVVKLTLDKLTNDTEFKDADWLLDGYPRSIEQAEALSKRFDLDCAINLNVTVPDEEIIERISLRQVHEPSGRTYHPSFKPPRVAGFDDETGEPLSRRADDHPDAVALRLREYHAQQGPIIDYYRKSGVLREFTGRRTDILWPQVRQMLLQDFKLRETKVSSHG